MERRLKRALVGLAFWSNGRCEDVRRCCWHQDVGASFTGGHSPYLQRRWPCGACFYGGSFQKGSWDSHDVKAGCFDMDGGSLTLKTSPVIPVLGRERLDSRWFLHETTGFPVGFFHIFWRTTVISRLVLDIHRFDITVQCVFSKR